MNLNKLLPQILIGYVDNKGCSLSTNECNELTKYVSGLELELTTAQEENKYLKTWIPEYLDDRLSRGEQTEIREFIRGKVDIDKLPQWLVNIVEENKRYKLALEDLLTAKKEVTASFKIAEQNTFIFEVSLIENLLAVALSKFDIAQSALNGGK
jgi:hypothetical protein